MVNGTYLGDAGDREDEELPAKRPEQPTPGRSSAGVSMTTIKNRAVHCFVMLLVGAAMGDTYRVSMDGFSGSLRAGLLFSPWIVACATASFAWTIVGAGVGHRWTVLAATVGLAVGAFVKAIAIGVQSFRLLVFGQDVAAFFASALLPAIAHAMGPPQQWEEDSSVVQSLPTLDRYLPAITGHSLLAAALGVALTAPWTTMASSVPGMLVVFYCVEGVLCLLGIVCALVAYHGEKGRGWDGIASISGLTRMPHLRPVQQSHQRVLDDPASVFALGSMEDEGDAVSIPTSSAPEHDPTHRRNRLCSSPFVAWPVGVAVDCWYLVRHPKVLVLSACVAGVACTYISVGMTTDDFLVESSFVRPNLSFIAEFGGAVVASLLLLATVKTWRRARWAAFAMMLVGSVSGIASAVILRLGGLALPGGTSVMALGLAGFVGFGMFGGLVLCVDLFVSAAAPVDPAVALCAHTAGLCPAIVGAALCAALCGNGVSPLVSAMVCFAAAILYVVLPALERKLARRPAHI
jgi:hypothetical protein